MTTPTIAVLPTAEQVRVLAAFATDQVQQTISRLKQRIPELAEEPRSAEAELILSVPKTLARVINHYARMLPDTLDGPDACPAAARDTVVPSGGPTAEGTPRPHHPNTTHRPKDQKRRPLPSVEGPGVWGRSPHVV